MKYWKNGNKLISISKMTEDIEDPSHQPDNVVPLDDDDIALLKTYVR